MERIKLLIVGASKLEVTQSWQKYSGVNYTCRDD